MRYLDPRQYLDDDASGDDDMEVASDEEDVDLDDHTGIEGPVYGFSGGERPDEAAVHAMVLRMHALSDDHLQVCKLLIQSR
jgi:hypothetical protein